MDKSLLQAKIKEFDTWVHEPGRIPEGSPVSFIKPGYLWGEETEFKTEVFDRAHKVLALESWVENDIGTGKIIDRVKAAISCDTHEIVNRNQKKSLLTELDNEELRHEMESALYDLYKTDNDQQSMDKIIHILPRRYDSISFLFFIKDAQKYLPVKAEIFGKCLEMVGIDYKLSGNCGWSNFIGFMNILSVIAEELNATLKIVPKATRMDAHSFLWIIGNQMVDETKQAEEYPAFKEISVDDEQTYKTQKEIALYFHKTVKPSGGAVKLNEKYMLWFIHTDKPDADWQNVISSDGLAITEINLRKQHKNETEELYRIAFANTDGKSFRFIGIFKLIDCGSKPYLEKKYCRVGKTFYTGDIEDTSEYDTQADRIIDDTIKILNISDTEKEALMKSRIGQGVFRRSLQDKYGKCALCGMINAKLLVASHIKEWKESDGTERLDVNNGLLLCAMHDSLFDHHLISFDDEGRILISQELSEADRKRCGINENMRIELNSEMKKYMKRHRAVFH